MKASSGLFLFILSFLIFPIVAQSQATTPTDITINRDGILLKGKFYMAEGAGVFPTVILLQGFPGNESDVLGLGKRLSASGFNVITFNYSGTFKSQGMTSWDNHLLDINSAYNFLHYPENISHFKIDTTMIYMGGWSHGGGLSLVYAASHPEITTVFSIAGNDFGEFLREYVRNPEMRKMIDDAFDNLAVPKGNVRFETGTLPKEMAEKGIENISPKYDLKKCAPLLAPKDILLIGGWNDTQATVDQFILPLYRALQKEKANNVRITAFQDNHYFRNSREEIAKTIMEWLKSAPERKKF